MPAWGTLLILIGYFGRDPASDLRPPISKIPELRQRESTAAPVDGKVAGGVSLAEVLRGDGIAAGRLLLQGSFFLPSLPPSTRFSALRTSSVGGLCGEGGRAVLGLTLDSGRGCLSTRSMCLVGGGRSASWLGS